MMAKILYGLAGEGMGHFSRSKVVIEHLIKRGHDVHIVGSGRANVLMKNLFPKVSAIPGLKLIYRDNSVQKLESLWTNLKPREGRKSFDIVRKLVREWNPDLMISDYEPTIAHIAGMVDWRNVFGKNKIPLISIDNMHSISNCTMKVPLKYKEDFAIVKYGNHLLIPPQNVSRFIITSFFFPPVKGKKSILVPSIVRDIVIKQKIRDKGHILVYQTSVSNTKMLESLKEFTREKFIVYGFDKEKREENLHFRKFSERGFIKDLADCKGAITNGGFSMMSEAVFLHKPVFSIPVKRQFEQICNAIYLEKEGYGEFHASFDTAAFKAFLYSIPDYKKNLKKYNQKDNKKALEEIDRAIRYVL